MMDFPQMARDKILWRVKHLTGEEIELDDFIPPIPTDRFCYIIKKNHREIVFDNRGCCVYCRINLLGRWVGNVTSEQGEYIYEFDIETQRLSRAYGSFRSVFRSNDDEKASTGRISIDVAYNNLKTKLDYGVGDFSTRFQEYIFKAMPHGNSLALLDSDKNQIIRMDRIVSD
jgi:hypothetical protein